MGQILHGSARTTAAIRRAIQHSQESLRTLARRHGINPKTVAKWRKRNSTEGHRTGPTVPKSIVLSVEQEAIIVAFRQHTLLPLDDCLYALQATMPQLTRSSLHRCLERHGISRLPEVEGDRPDKRKKFDSYLIGFFHIDLAEVRTAEGKLYLFVAIDRTSKFALVALVECADMRAAFLEALVAAVPYRIHTVLTDNGNCATLTVHWYKRSGMPRRRCHSYYRSRTRITALAVKSKPQETTKQMAKPGPGIAPVNNWVFGLIDVAALITSNTFQSRSVCAL